MKNLLEPIKLYLKKVFSDLHNAVIGVIVAAIILSGGGIYLYAQQLGIQLKNIAQSPTPLWATAALVLVVVAHMYSKNQVDPKNTPIRPKFDFVPDGNIKWKATLFANGGYRIEDTPFCIELDLQLLSFNGVYLCQKAEQDNCETMLYSKDHEYRKQCVESRAELQFRK